MSEYYTQKTLQNILEELVLHCLMVDPKIDPLPVDIKLVLPKNIIKESSKFAIPKERVVLDGDTNKPFVIRHMNFIGGKVELLATEDVEITIKDNV